MVPRPPGQSDGTAFAYEYSRRARFGDQARSALAAYLNGDIPLDTDGPIQLTQHRSQGTQEHGDREYSTLEQHWFEATNQIMRREGCSECSLADFDRAISGNPVDVPLSNEQIPTASRALQEEVDHSSDSSAASPSSAGSGAGTSSQTPAAARMWIDRFTSLTGYRATTGEAIEAVMLGRPLAPWMTQDIASDCRSLSRDSEAHWVDLASFETGVPVTREVYARIMATIADESRPRR